MRLVTVRTSPRRRLANGAADSQDRRRSGLFHKCSSNSRTSAVFNCSKTEAQIISNHSNHSKQDSEIPGCGSGLASQDSTEVRAAQQSTEDLRGLGTLYITLLHIGML